MNEVVALIKKEIALEWKQKYAFNGLLLYVVSTVFICYLAFKGSIDSITWNALFWIIQLFASINAVAKSFLTEHKNRMLYYYTIASAEAVIFSKLIYNSVLLLLLSIFSLMFFILFIGNPVEDGILFLLAVILGSLGFSGVTTLISAIASKAGSNSTLLAILSFPILLPLLLTILKLSKNAIEGFGWSVSYNLVIILVAINLITFTLSYILFPYLWRD